MAIEGFNSADIFTPVRSQYSTDENFAYRSSRDKFQWFSNGKKVVWSGPRRWYQRGNLVIRILKVKPCVAHALPFVETWDISKSTATLAKHSAHHFHLKDLVCPFYSTPLWCPHLRGKQTWSLPTNAKQRYKLAIVWCWKCLQAPFSALFMWQKSLAITASNDQGPSDADAPQQQPIPASLVTVFDKSRMFLLRYLDLLILFPLQPVVQCPSREELQKRPTRAFLPPQAFTLCFVGSCD